MSSGDADACSLEGAKAVRKKPLEFQRFLPENIQFDVGDELEVDMYG
jgi:hypothetical protein